MQSVNEVSALDALKAQAIERMVWARSLTSGLLDGLSDEQLTSRAGGAGNHALWIMGHIAVSDDMLISMVAGEPGVLPESYGKLFGPGSEPSEDASAYPSRGELLDAMDKSRQRAIAWTESLDESSARQPTPKQLQQLAPDMITLPISLAMHEFVHTGQLTAVRASLGIPRLHG